jgi:alanine racemase
MRSWIEISRVALRENIRMLRALTGDRILCAIVKANAYGHGIREVAAVIARERAFTRGGAGWFGVDSLPEALVLRDAGIAQPIIILGYVPIADLRAAIRARTRVTVSTVETIRALGAAARSLRGTVPVHVKVETGTQRQGMMEAELPAVMRLIARSRGLVVEGISTHLADVEDTGPDGFAAVQLERFDRAASVAEQLVGHRLLRHTSASAAAMLFPDARFDLVRPGIALYGLWPSDRVETIMMRRDRAFQLRPVLTWKTMVGPMHEVPKGAPVGYGCTERVRRRTRIAVLPVGYWDGYDRKLSSVGTVLIRGHRCKVIGRICMNMCMVDVTDVPRVRLEDEAVLLGHQGREWVTAEDLAEKIGTINYEVVTRINPVLPRKLV